MWVDDRCRQLLVGSRVSRARRCTASVSFPDDQRLLPPASTAARRWCSSGQRRPRRGPATPAPRRRNSRCPADRQCRRGCAAALCRRGRRRTPPSNRKHSFWMTSSELTASTPRESWSRCCSSTEDSRRDLVGMHRCKLVSSVTEQLRVLFTAVYTSN